MDLKDIILILILLEWSYIIRNQLSSNDIWTFILIYMYTYLIDML